jgi:hypothetical protein
LWRYSVDLTIRAGKRQTFFDDKVGRIYPLVADKRPMPRRGGAMIVPCIETLGHDIDSIADLQAAINAYLAEHNASPKVAEA